jgi:hypothetical protein
VDLKATILRKKIPLDYKIIVSQLFGDDLIEKASGF